MRTPLPPSPRRRARHDLPHQTPSHTGSDRTWRVVPGWLETRFIFAEGKCLAEVNGTARDAALIAAAPHLYLTLESCAASLERHAQVVHVPTLQTFMREVIQIRTALADVDGVDKMPSQRRRKRTKKDPASV